MGSERKSEYFSKLLRLLDEYPKFVLVGADHVGSNQFQRIRIALRGKGVVLMGKKTMVRKAFRGHIKKNPALEQVMPLLKGNVGFVFTKGELGDIMKVVNDTMVEAPARAGVVAPTSVMVPAQQTALEPTQTSFFQALNIPTKITKGAIEIMNNVDLIAKGDKVTASQAALLQKLSIKPFKYGLEIQHVYDNGEIYDIDVLSVSPDMLLDKLRLAVKNVTGIALALGQPSQVVVPQQLARAFRSVLGLSYATDVTSDKLESFKTASKSAAASGPAPAAAAAAAAAPAAAGGKKEEKKEEKEESDGDMGLDLFG